jgi:hypothetical protein
MPSSALPVRTPDLSFNTLAHVKNEPACLSNITSVGIVLPSSLSRETTRWEVSVM